MKFLSGGFNACILLIYEDTISTTIIGLNLFIKKNLGLLFRLMIFVYMKKTQNDWWMTTFRESVRRESKSPEFSMLESDII